ncbi:MAG: hypothetical protein ACYCO3_15235 [Mycobacteriales bacterium]
MPAGSNVPSFQWSAGHLELHLLPAIAVIIGGIMLFASRRRSVRFGATLALLGGVWFVVGPTISTAWLGSSMGMSGGMVMASTFMKIVTPLGYHYGTGVVIAALAATALGLASVARRQLVPPARREAGADTQNRVLDLEAAESLSNNCGLSLLHTGRRDGGGLARRVGVRDGE